ncbi:AAA family ATPase [Streptomyces albidoflavus]
MTRPPREHPHHEGPLAAEIERARSGSGRLVLLRGATGTGRTTALDAAVRAAAARGLRVLRARCSPEDTGVPLAAVRQLLSPEDEFADLVPEGDERGTAARLWRTLRTYAAEAPLLVAVDDVHLADDPSRRWLLDAARRLDRLPLLLVATERSQYDIEPRPPGLAQSLAPSLVRTRTVAPLGDEAAAALVREAFPAAGEVWAEACVRAGAGVPLFLHALLDDLGATPWPEPDAPAADGVPALPESCAALYPGSYPAAVSWWLENAGAATAEVARCLAALEEAWPSPSAAGDTGTDAPPEPPHPSVRERPPTAGGSGAAARDPAGLLAEAAGADPARVAGWLAAMGRLGLLRTDAAGRPRYAHPLLRDAVLTGWPLRRRQAAHRAAAEAMTRRGDRVEEVARHLLRVPAAGPPWALRVLRDAATVAVHDARPYDAVGYLRRALEEELTGDLRQRLLTQLGSLEYASADAPAAIARLAEAQHLPAGPRDRVRTAVALGAALAARGEIRIAMEVLRRAGGSLSGHPGLARTVRAASALVSDGDLASRQEVYRWLCETGERSPELVGTAGQALLVRYAATAGLVSAPEAMRRMRELLAQPTDPLAEPFLVGTAAAVAQWADELDEADRLVERGLAGQHPGLLHPMLAALLNTGSDIAAARGDHARLLASGRAGRQGEARAVPTNQDAHVLMALVHTGRTDEARGFAGRFDLNSAPDGWEVNRFLYARGVLRSATGDPAGAVHDFLECGRRQSAREVVSPVVTPWRSAVAACRLELGGGQEALDLATEEVRLARVWGTPRTVGRALSVLGTATGGRHGLELAEEAVDTLREVPGDPLAELIPALLAQGRQLVAAGERGRGRVRLREAAELAERSGAVRWLGLASQALREGGARHPAAARTGSVALTDSEHRIATLAAEGHTNTEIADLLHLARRTVETHLTSTYRKLGIRRRTELPGRLERGPVRAPRP